MSRTTQHLPGNWYHIYNRGVDKRVIFNDKNDYDRFAKFLFLHNTNKNINFRDIVMNNEVDAFDLEQSDRLIDVVAWVLMPNHFHLLVYIPEDSEINVVAKFMQKLGTAYTMYFNKRNDRNGSLFQGTFKSKLVDNESYLMYLLAYIHLNPIKLIQTDWKENGIDNTVEACKFLKNYEYSSFVDYTEGDIRKYSKIINREKFPKGICNLDTFEIDIFNWITEYRNFP